MFKGAWFDLPEWLVLLVIPGFIVLFLWVIKQEINAEVLRAKVREAQQQERERMWGLFESYLTSKDENGLVFKIPYNYWKAFREKPDLQRGKVNNNQRHGNEVESDIDLGAH